MNTSTRLGRCLLYILVFLSGVAGLIYQVVWHRYLSILLGAQARATAIVLAIFLGGISAGYLCFGRWTRTKKWNLLLTYVLVELALTFWAYCFPYFFDFLFARTPAILSVLGMQSLFVDVTLSLLLIGFPTFLMGGTLPLLTQAVSDDLAEASDTHARIYGYNTVGACAGSLLAGYVLIPLTSLPVTVVLAGSANLVVACAGYFLFAKYAPTNKPIGFSATRDRKKGRKGDLPLLIAGFLSGFYVITLETVMIRLMGLATGSSNYTFTLIVSIFVLALGLGSLLARRIAKYTSARLVWNQLALAFFLFLVYLSGDFWPYWVHLVRIVFRDVAVNFYLYQAALGIVFLLLLAIPIGLCGLTLPFLFHLLKDRKETLGHRVGQLYGINTVGCVIGALFGGYLVLGYLNLDQIFKLCIVLALASLGCAVFYSYRQTKKSGVLWAGVGGAWLFLMVLIAPGYNKERYFQPFRQQHPLPVSYKGLERWTNWLKGSTAYLAYEDGPNTSVMVGVNRSSSREMSRTIFVNGKSDGNTSGDLFTMSLTGNIPGLLARRLDKICVVGMGTGITIGALADFEETKTIDVAEIAGTLIKFRSHFDAYNGEMSKSSKIKLHEMDAFRFLGGTTQTFDVIVSEPSNPWVAGVENLYTTEFYDIAKRKLAKDGLYVQWVQAYSFTDELLRSVLKTITSRFRYVSVFQMLEADLALVASDEPITKADLERAALRYQSQPRVRTSLARLGIHSLETVLALEIVQPWTTSVLGGDTSPLSIEEPRLSYGAAVAFFLGVKADIHQSRRETKEYFASVKDSLLSKYLDDRGPSAKLLEEMSRAFCADGSPGKNRHLCQETLIMGKWVTPNKPWEALFETELISSEWRGLSLFGGSRGPASFSGADLQRTKQALDFFKKYYSPVARLPIGKILSQLDTCLKTSPKKAEIRGDCLLFRAAALEVSQPNSPGFYRTIRDFALWFGELSPSSTAYPRFKRAFEILDKGISDNASSVM